MQLVIPAQYIGGRLDKALVDLLCVTRSRAQAMILRGAVRVNDMQVKTGHALREDDVVVVEDVPVSPREVRGALSPALIPTVLAETDDYLVIAKPSGLTVHTAVHAKSPILTDWLTVQYPAIARVGDDLDRPGVVHRLDKDASGVMVIAKTQDAFEGLKRQFKVRTVKKEYLILIEGVMGREEGEITLNLTRSTTKKTKIAATSGEGREAITKYQVLEKGAKASLVRVMPETGRTHQIRVHFFATGHPVAGDPLYHAKTPILKAKRLMLHAVKLGFHDLAGVWREYECPPDAEFARIVDNSLALR